MGYKHRLNRRYFLAQFAYFGENFFGVQEQPHHKTVLGALRARIYEAAAENAKHLVVAARTDKGVSALKNYASFYINNTDNKFIERASEPRDDGLFSVKFFEAARAVNARGQASLKTYCYCVKDGVKNPRKLQKLVWEIVPTLSISAMKFAARDFLGEQDFSSMRGGGCEAGRAVKKLVSLSIFRTTSGYIIFEITGYGFLRHMVRNIVGLLIEIGAGIKAFDAVEQILQQKSRLAAGIMAPAHGLFLQNVWLQKKLCPSA